MKKLNLGCGDHPLDSSWINTDIFCIDPRVRYLDVRERFPFDDNSIDRIFTEHMIEHLTGVEGQRCIKECFRVLAPGGRIRISFPSLDFLIALATEPMKKEHWKYGHWAGKEFNLPWELSSIEITANMAVNNFFYNFGHRFMWTGQAMIDNLAGFGFEGICECRIKESSDSEFQNLENDSRMPPGFLQLETMTIEAEKPLT
jgi:predicted SAM-dependent methyltransferase